MSKRPRLVAVIDGAPLPEEEARALWKRFSEHMDVHQGDMAGFAAQNGFASVSPEYRAGQAVLVVCTKGARAEQQAGTSKPAGGGKLPEDRKPTGGKKAKRR